MAIEITSEEKIGKKILTKAFFYSIVVVFLLFFLSCFGLYFSQKKLKKEISNIEKKLQITAEEQALREAFLNQRNKINDFSVLVSRYQSFGKVLNYLEQSVHPEVKYSSFKFDLEKESLNISGQTESLKTLGQQALIFTNQEFVKNLELISVSTDKDGRIKFELQLILNPEILRFK